MIKFILPTIKHKADVLAFYDEFTRSGGTCIGITDYQNYEKWLQNMINRKEEKNLPDGYVRENFYLCYDEDKMIGVFSIKFKLTNYLIKYGGHIGYAVLPSKQNQGLGNRILKDGLNLARQLGFNRVLCVCDDDNVASEKIILKNGGVFENKLYDSIEDVHVKRFWIEL